MTEPISARVAGEVLSLLEGKQILSPTSRKVMERYIATWQCDILAALTETNLITESLLAETLADGYGLPLCQSVIHDVILSESISLLPFAKARSWEMILVSRKHHGPHLVVANPAQKERIEKIRLECPMGFTLSVGERSDIVRAVDELYPLAAQLPSLHAK